MDRGTLAVDEAMERVVAQSGKLLYESNWYDVKVSRCIAEF